MFARFEQFLVSNGSIVPKQIPCLLNGLRIAMPLASAQLIKFLRLTRKSSPWSIWRTLAKSGKSNRLNSTLRLYTFFVSRYGL
jgi:hypothetical protein